MKCKCKSAPDYHREDCPQYDIYGNLVNEFFIGSIKNIIDFEIKRGRSKGKKMSSITFLDKNNKTIKITVPIDYYNDFKFKVNKLKNKKVMIKTKIHYDNDYHQDTYRYLDLINN